MPVLVLLDQGKALTIFQHSRQGFCEQREYDFESWSDFIEACKQYPEEQQIYWLHLQQKPADWDDDVFAPFPDDGLLVFGTK